MKKLLLVLLVCAGGAYAATKSVMSSKMATVNMAQGKYVYIDCQPVDSFEVVFVLKEPPVVWSHSDWNSVSKIKKKMVNKCNNKGIPFDAVIIDGDNTATAIRFK